MVYRDIFIIGLEGVIYNLLNDIITNDFQWPLRVTWESEMSCHFMHSVYKQSLLLDAIDLQYEIPPFLARDAFVAVMFICLSVCMSVWDGRPLWSYGAC